MTFEEKITQLRSNIREKLTPLITGDYIHLDNPYHTNIGDTLIWEGECQFLSSLPYKCLQSSSSATWRRKPLSPVTVLLLHGGGNFGDLWAGSQDFRKRIIEDYPNNRIIMFPQSVWYNDKSLIEKDAAMFAKHKDLYLCARDAWSYEFMKKFFGANHIMLVPDMAFCIDDAKLAPYRGRGQGKELYFKRTDRELDTDTLIQVSKNVDIHEWPSIEHPSQQISLFLKMIGAYRRLDKLKMAPAIFAKRIDDYANSIVRPYLVRMGCEFLAPYDHVITTRLHALILSVLLHKPVDYIDNKTGKLSAFVSTWLTDLDGVKGYE